MTDFLFFEAPLWADEYVDTPLVRISKRLSQPIFCFSLPGYQGGSSSLDCVACVLEGHGLLHHGQSAPAGLLRRLLDDLSPVGITGAVPVTLLLWYGAVAYYRNEGSHAQLGPLL